jgi:hypothetical protein
MKAKLSFGEKVPKIIKEPKIKILFIKFPILFMTAPPPNLNGPNEKAELTKGSSFGSSAIYFRRPITLCSPLKKDLGLQGFYIPIHPRIQAFFAPSFLCNHKFSNTILSTVELEGLFTKVPNHFPKIHQIALYFRMVRMASN